MAFKRATADLTWGETLQNVSFCLVAPSQHHQPGGATEFPRPPETFSALFQKNKNKRPQTAGIAHSAQSIDCIPQQWEGSRVGVWFEWNGARGSTECTMLLSECWWHVAECAHRCQFYCLYGKGGGQTGCER